MKEKDFTLRYSKKDIRIKDFTLDDVIKAIQIYGEVTGQEDAEEECKYPSPEGMLSEIRESESDRYLNEVGYRVSIPGLPGGKLLFVYMNSMVSYKDYCSITRHSGAMLFPRSYSSENEARVSELRRNFDLEWQKYVRKTRVKRFLRRFYHQK